MGETIKRVHYTVPYGTERFSWHPFQPTFFPYGKSIPTFFPYRKSRPEFFLTGNRYRHFSLTENEIRAYGGNFYDWSFVIDFSCAFRHITLVERSIRVYYSVPYGTERFSWHPFLPTFFPYGKSLPTFFTYGDWQMS
jgi:hypothetical protein